jgi:parallel beta-helix repeat protein
MQKLKRMQMLWAGIMVISSLTLVGIPYAQGAIWYVKTDGSDTNGGTSWEDSFQTIQRGIDEASIGDTVLVADGTYTGSGNKDLDYNGKAITVKSKNGPDNCIIDCENSGRGFHFQSGEGVDSIVSGFTITNGNKAGDYGGAIYCYDSSTPTIANCIIKGNRSGFGGGVSLLYSGATLTNCKIINNISEFGGGIYSIFAWKPTDNLIITNCTIIGNTATRIPGNGQGGGILFGGPFSGASMTVTNSSIGNNTADRDGGGGIYLGECANPPITNCIFWDNTPEAIFVNNCSPVVTYSNGSGYTGEGNMEDAPLFMDVTDPDPINWNLRLRSNSPCIDKGSNSAAELPFNDLDAKPRIIDGDGNELPIADMGAYEFGDICECDFDDDLDQDGVDLADYTSENGGYDLSIFAADFARDDCPVYLLTP